jgi:putative endopeptidase
MEKKRASAQKTLYAGVPPFAKSISPGTNFYGYVNANWLKGVNMPSYASSYGVSEEMEDSIKPTLQRIVKKAQDAIVQTPNKELDKKTILLGSLMQSCVDRGSQQENIKFVRSLVTNLRCMRDVNDVGAAIGEFVKYRVSTAVTATTAPEEIHSKRLRLILGQGGLGLPDTSYYTLEVSQRTHTLEAYNKLIQKLGDDFEVSNLNLFVGIERIVANAVEESRGDEEELFKGSELRKTYADFPWLSFAESAFGFSPSEFNDFTFLIVSPRWFRFMNKWFRTWNLENWRVWLAGSTLLYCLPLLSSPYDTMYFELFGKRLRGQVEKQPRHLLGLNLCKEWLSSALGQEYIDLDFDPKTKREVTHLANEIKESAIDRLEKTEWMEPNTRRKAIEKVKDIYLGIAYPSSFPPIPDVSLNPEQLVKNIFALGSASFARDIAFANKELHPEKWEDAVFEVNAYYYNEGNRLILPAGILREPFYSSKFSDGWNFGGIGATIGHELTHAFDTDGKNYDEEGNLNPWWTAKDNRAYNKKTKAIIALYNRTTYFNQPVNGTLTLSENIADLGGLALALATLKKRLEKRRVSDETRKKELCDFFVSYAITWRTKEKRKKALQSIFTDVHAPPIARVNNIVRQFDDWYECFDIKPGNLLYTAPVDRIRIF